MRLIGCVLQTAAVVIGEFRHSADLLTKEQAVALKTARSRHCIIKIS